MWQILKYLPRILKDTFLYNYYKRIGKCDFPISILPKLNYTPLIDIQSLLNCQTIYILRRSDKSFNDTFNDLGKLREDALAPKEIPFLSLNMLGGLFKPEYTKFKVQKKGMSRWKNNDFISILDFLNDYSNIESYCLVYIEANRIDGQGVPYSQTVTNDLKREMDAFFEHMDKPIITENRFKLEGETKLIHDPINLNYWHLELNVLDFKKQPIKYKSSKYIEEFCKKVITDIICVNSSSELPEIQNIPKHFYKTSIFKC